MHMRYSLTFKSIHSVFTEDESIEVGSFLSGKQKHEHIVSLSRCVQI